MYNMNGMHIDQLELGEIRLLAELAELRKLSSAAARLNLSQSAASHALSRLRKRAGDPLFIRGRDGFAPTPYGERLSRASRAALDILLDGLAANAPFAPDQSTRRFNVFFSDVGQMVVLPKLLAFMDRSAPMASLRACPIPLQEPASPLASGEVDLAVGFFNTLTAGFRQNVLFRERYVCVVSSDNPDFVDGMSDEAFRKAPRALADASGMAHAEMENYLRKQGFGGTSRLIVPQFMVLPLLIPGSKLLVVMPSRLAKTFAQFLPIKILRPPVPLRPYDIKIYWHERFHRDPANRWLRRSLVELFRK